MDAAASEVGCILWQVNTSEPLHHTVVGPQLRLIRTVMQQTLHPSIDRCKQEHQFIQHITVQLIKRFQQCMKPVKSTRTEVPQAQTGRSLGRGIPSQPTKGLASIVSSKVQASLSHQWFFVHFTPTPLRILTKTCFADCFHLCSAYM